MSFLICVFVDLLMEKDWRILDEKVDCGVLFCFVLMGFVFQRQFCTMQNKFSESQGSNQCCRTGYYWDIIEKLNFYYKWAGKTPP